MSTRRMPLWCLALTLLILPLTSRATTVVAPEFDSLVNQADYVVRAVVKSVSSEWQTNGEDKHIITKVELEVSEVIKGTPPQPLVLEMLGGKVGGIEMAVEGAPKFSVGDEDILFVHGNGQQFSPLVGIMYGRYPIYQDTKTGTDYVLRSNGMPLYSEKDVSLPLSKLGAVKSSDSSSQPMTAASFISKIKVSAGNSNTSSHALN